MITVTKVETDNPCYCCGDPALHVICFWEVFGASILSENIELCGDCLKDLKEALDKYEG